MHPLLTFLDTFSPISMKYLITFRHAFGQATCFGDIPLFKKLAPTIMSLGIKTLGSQQPPLQLRGILHKHVIMSFVVTYIVEVLDVQALTFRIQRIVRRVQGIQYMKEDSNLKFELRLFLDFVMK